MKAWRRRGGLGVVATAPAEPILTAIEPDTLSWVWSGTNPSFWVIQFDYGGETGWDTWEEVPGTDRDDTSLPAGTYRIFGRDDFPVTPTSNEATIVGP